MTTAQEVRKIRKELAESGADPFAIAAQALEQVARYRQIVAQLEEQLRR